MTRKSSRKAVGPGMMIERPVTPAVSAIGRLNITGNVTPHVWYLRSEFRTPAGRPDRNMITAVADILYWYKPQEVRDEEQGGIFVGYARKFQRDMLQYDYERRAAIFGMSKREMQEACKLAAKRGLIKIEYRTEKFRNSVLHNVVYVEPVAEAIEATLSGPDVEPVLKSKGAARGRHLKAAGEDEGIDDQIPEDEDMKPGLSDSGEGEHETQGASQNFERLSETTENETSQNFETSTLQNFEIPPPEFRDTYHESSLETSSREFGGGALHVTDNPRAQEEPTSAPVAVLELLERTTSEQASPSTPSVAQTADGPLGAGAPDGATPEGLEVTDEDLQTLFGSQGENATDVEQVPGGAAGEAARPPTIDDLAPVPEAELLERPQAVAGDPVYKAIAALAGGAAKLEVLLAEATRSGGYGRERWLRLNVEEVERVKVTAQGEARQPGPDGKRVPFSTLSILGLDRLIGAPKQAQAVGPVPLGTAYQSPEVQRQQQEAMRVEVGSTWLGRKSGKPFLIEEANGRSVFVEGLGEYPLVKFHQLFTAAD